MLAFKPEARPLWEESKSNIIKYISGELKMEKLDEDMCYGITETEELHKFLQNAIVVRKEQRKEKKQFLMIWNL